MTHYSRNVYNAVCLSSVSHIYSFFCVIFMTNILCIQPAKHHVKVISGLLSSFWILWNMCTFSFVSWFQWEISFCPCAVVYSLVILERMNRRRWNGIKRKANKERSTVNKAEDDHSWDPGQILTHRPRRWRIYKFQLGEVGGVFCSVWKDLQMELVSGGKGVNVCFLVGNPYE